MPNVVLSFFACMVIVVVDRVSSPAITGSLKVIVQSLSCVMPIESELLGTIQDTN